MNVFTLRNAADRARQRVAQCRREAERFAYDHDRTNPAQVRTLRKLRSDLRLAEIDAGHADNMLDQALAGADAWSRMGST